MTTGTGFGSIFGGVGVALSRDTYQAPPMPSPTATMPPNIHTHHGVAGAGTGRATIWLRCV